MKYPSKELVRELFNYDPITGFFTAKVAKPHRKIGAVVGTKKDNGYLHFSVEGKKYGAHRIAWLYFYGEMPKGDIDHIDGNRTNNSINNLRCVDRSTNLENMRQAKSHNKSTGLIGSYKINDCSFASRIQVKGKDIYLGVFRTAEEANAAYIKAKRVMHSGNTI